MTIFIPTPLRPYAEDKDSVEVNATTIAGALELVAQTYPDLQRSYLKVTLSSRVNPAANGLSVVLISTVQAASLTIPTGKVQLMEGTRLLAEADLDAGTITFKQLDLLPGKHILSALYLGDKLHKPSTSSPIHQVIGTIRRPVPIQSAPRRFMESPRE